MLCPLYHEDNGRPNTSIDYDLMDAFRLNETFESELKEDSDFQVLCRIINDQTTLDEEETIHLKKVKKISATSLQTPVEPEAAYRYKSGKHYKGFVANVVETVRNLCK